MKRFSKPLVLIGFSVGFACAALNPDHKTYGETQPPLEIKFLEFDGLGGKDDELSCGIPKGRDSVYDAQTGFFHIQFKTKNYAVCAFEVTEVADRIAKLVTFRLTGVPTEMGCLGVPLTLTIGDKRHSIEEGPLAVGPVDRSLFRVVRTGNLVTIAFTEKGQALVKPGARISFKVDNGW